MNIKRLSLWLALVFISSCGEDPAPVSQEETITIFFDSQSKMEIKENNNSEITIPIKLSLSQETPVVVTYEVIGQEVVNGSDFTILSNNPLTIPAGSLQVPITLRINNNEIVQPEERNIYIRIRSINQDNVKISVPKEVVISIKEDDCLPEMSKIKIWIGALTLQNQNDTSTGTGLENASGSCGGSFDVKGKFVGDENPESTVTLKLTQDPLISTLGTVIVTRTKLFNFTSQFEVEATGNYDETTKKITLNYLFFDLNNNANNFSSTMVITTNN